MMDGTRNYAEILSETKIPERMHGGLVRYLVDKIPPGNFLRAVLENDLIETCARADEENKGLLFEYVQFLYTHAPKEAWGNEEKVAQWLGRRGK